MITLHTQKSLDQLTWNEIQKLHSSLGLKATAATRTRRDYQRRIVEAQPQPVVEPEHTATTLTCAVCPLARHIDGDRYCCGLTDKVTRGHWEAQTDCYDAVAEAQSETETTEPAAEVEAPIALETAPQEIAATTDDAPPNRGDNGRGRVTALTALEATIVLPHAAKPKADDNFMTAFTRESEFERKFNDLAYLSQLEMEAQLAIERTVIGSEEEAITYARLRQIEADIKYYGQPKLEPQPSPAIQQLETQMKELKADVLSLFKITAFDPSILPTCDDEPEQSTIQSESEPEGTIHWTTPLQGVIVGKKGAIRHFYIRNDEIFIMLSSDFTASETKHPNIRHAQIRAAIEAGRTFDPRIFKVSPNFEQDTQACNGGRICQECDGRWWAWADGSPTGHPFFDRETACKYLKKVSQNQRQELARKNVICAK